MNTIVKVAVFGMMAGCAYATWHYVERPTHTVYEAQPLERGAITAIVSATGACNALTTVDIGAQITGMITRLYVDFDSHVKKGQLLAQIDPQPFEASLNQAQANLDSAKANAEAARVSVQQAKIAVAVAQSQSEAQKQQANVAKTVASFDKLELDRSQAGATAGVTLQQDMLDARATYEQASDSADVAQAQEQTSLVGIQSQLAQVDLAQEQLTVAESQVAQAQAGVQQAQVNLDRTRITSPIDGLVLAVDVQAGQTVVSSAVAPTLFTLVQDLGKIQVDVSLDESDVARAKVGQPATFTVDAYPNQTFQAKVRQIREQPTNVQNVITYDVVLDVIDPPVQLFPGMTTSVTITSASKSNVMKVPNAALRFRPPGAAEVKIKAVASASATVYVLSDGKPVARKMLPGVADSHYTEVLSGDLHDGDRVVTGFSIQR
ncbi:MAG: efflux RND transporter periplasmic adaptor subunit [Acidobacteriota bacterium]